jgi:predicted nucleotidyltransferase
MNLSKPLTSLIPSLEGEVLTVLATAEVAFTGAQVQRVIGNYSAKGVRNALQRLSDEGIVNRVSAGAADLYSLNRKHILCSAILAISKSKQEFTRLISAEIGKWKIQPLCAALFGSASRADMSRESDIDIFLARPAQISFENEDWRNQVTRLSRNGFALTGNQIQIFELSPLEIKKEFKTKNGVISSILQQGLVIHGPEDFLTSFKR